MWVGSGSNPPGKTTLLAIYREGSLLSLALHKDRRNLFIPRAVGHFPGRSPVGGCIPTSGRARIAPRHCPNFVGNPKQNAPQEALYSQKSLGRPSQDRRGRRKIMHDGPNQEKRLGAGGRGNLFRIESPRIRKTATGPKIAKITILFSREIQCHSKRPHRGPVFKQGRVPSAPS